MINVKKYQQGGAAPQSGGGVMQRIAQLPTDQQQQIMAAFQEWATGKGIDVAQIQNNPEAMEQAMTQFLQEMQQRQATSAKHGAKLQYIKDLKGTCPDGTHLEYYKAGGRLCKKCAKNQEGGEMEQQKKGGVLAQYKEKVNKNCGGAKMKAGCGAKMKKHQIGGTIETLRQSLGLEKKNEITKAQAGLKFGGSNKSNRFAPKPVKSIPEVTVNGIDRRWRFDRRNADLGNGHHVINDVIYDYYDGGNSYLGDLAVVKGGRTIYTGPKGNDTIFFKNPNTLRMVGDHFMEMGPAQKGARRNFYNVVRNKPLLPGSPEEKQALIRARRGN